MREGLRENERESEVRERGCVCVCVCERERECLGLLKHYTYVMLTVIEDPTRKEGDQLAKRRHSHALLKYEIASPVSVRTGSHSNDAII